MPARTTASLSASVSACSAALPAGAAPAPLDTGLNEAMPIESAPDPHRATASPRPATPPPARRWRRCDACGYTDTGLHKSEIRADLI